MRYYEIIIVFDKWMFDIFIHVFMIMITVFIVWIIILMVIYLINFDLNWIMYNLMDGHIRILVVSFIIFNE